MGGTVTATNLEALYAVACIPFDSEIGCGFALPLFATLSAPTVFFVQEMDEYSNTVSGFSRLSEDLVSSIELVQRPTSEIGKAPIYSFFDEKGNAVVGQLKAIDSALLSFAGRCPQFSAITLQIFELVGTQKEKQLARSRMRQTILDASGVAAAKAFYEGSVLRTLLWDQLVIRAPSVESARRILGARSKLDFNIGDRGNVSLNLDALDPSDYENIDLTSIAHELENEIKRVEVATPPHISIVDQADLFGNSGIDLTIQQDRNVDEALSLISRTGQQEERLAILLDTILGSRTTGKQLLKHYSSDRAQYADAAIKEIISALDNPFTYQKKQTQVELSDNERPSAETLIDIPLQGFSHGMPKNRALLFYYLSKHLGKYPNARKALRARYLARYSIYFRPYENEIRKFLEIE
ncbi:MAG TPA: hypothetical protein VGN05_06145 [Parvibaculum sp.]|jgi:hypothetical protein